MSHYTITAYVATLRNRTGLIWLMRPAEHLAPRPQCCAQRWIRTNFPLINNQPLTLMSFSGIYFRTRGEGRTPNDLFRRQTFYH